MKAIVTVIGKDTVGIIAKVSGLLSEWNANIEDISQTIMQNNFVMVMFVDLSNAKLSIAEMDAHLSSQLQVLNVSVRMQHADIFNAMHRI